MQKKLYAKCNHAQSVVLHQRDLIDLSRDRTKLLREKSWIIFRAAEKLGEGFSNCVWKKKILTGASFQNERDF